MSSTSNTVSVISGVTSTFKWVVNNFCCSCNNMPEVIKSPVFATSVSITKQEWQLWLYPKGYGKININYLSIYVFHKSGPNTIAEAIFTLLNTENNRSKIESAKKYAFTEDKDVWGSPRFVERQFIMDKKNGVINDNQQFTILCEIIEDDSPKDKQKYTRSVDLKHPSRLREFDQFEKLLGDDAMSDISIIIEGKELRAHKCVLVKRSDVFAAMFAHEMKETHQNKVEITDTRYEVFAELLRFVYTGKINDSDRLAGELLAAADKYALEGLKSLCVWTLCKNLNPDNALESVKLADLHSADNLKTRAIQIIIQNAEGFIDSPELLTLASLSPDIVSEVIRGLTLKNK